MEEAQRERSEVTHERLPVSSPATAKAKREHHVPYGALGLLELVVLGVLAAFLTLWAIPHAFAIEWECLAKTGGVRSGDGDFYESGVVVIGTVGWLLVSIGVLYSRIFDSRRGTLLLPAVWFGIFVLGALIVATALGSQPCAA
jgi:hypothetical protein